MSTSRIDARPLVSAAVVAGLVLAAVAGTTFAGTSASAATNSVNPFADAGGFSVYTIGDANLDNTEIEGALAVGGTLRGATPGNRLPIVHYVAGTPNYAVPVIDGDTTRLLVGGFSTASGIVDVSGAGAPTGVDKGYAKIVNPDLATFVFAERGGFVQYKARAIAGSESSGPVIEGKNHVWAADGVARFVAEGTSVASYVELGEGFDAVTQCLASPADGTVTMVSIANDGGKAQLTLVAGTTNIINYADLFFGGQPATQITYAGSVRPSADAPVIVRVPAGTTAVRGQSFDPQGQYANYVMWDLSRLSGSVTLTDRYGTNTRIDGSIFAPNVDLSANFGPLDGQVIAKTLTTLKGSGELHAFMFKGQIECGSPVAPTTSPDPTVSPEPTVSPNPTVTPSASPSVDPSVSPSATPSATPSVSPSIPTEPGEVPSPSASPSVTPSATPSATPLPTTTPGGGTAEGELPAGGGELSGTGFDGMALVWIAGIAIAAGAAFVAMGRRRTED